MKKNSLKAISISSLKSSSNSVKRRVVVGLGGIMLFFTVITISWTSSNTPAPAPAATEIKLTPASAPVVVAISALEQFEQSTKEVYKSAKLKEAGMDYQVFKKALVGYYNLKHKSKLSSDKSLITIVDLNKPSVEKRLWIVDVEKKEMLFNTLVAHGNGSGVNIASAFSNTPHSNQSSLGFYVTGETYNGKHGLSLKLNGMDNGYNTNAYTRGVVVHGAEYVSDDFIKLHGRLGRSQGCPALPMNVKDRIISTIKNKTCMFIAGPQPEYSSDLLNEEVAANGFSQFASGNLQASL